WRVRLPSGQAFEWDAIIRENRERGRITWESVQGSRFDHRGHITFTRAGGDRGTVVNLEIRYHLPAGSLGVLLAKLQGADPQHEAAEALRRFKQWVETGEFATNRGPSARGPGRTRGSRRQAAFPDVKPTRQPDRVQE